MTIVAKLLVAWNKWRREHPDIRPDLSGADLFTASLESANLVMADLYHASLEKANLSEGPFGLAAFLGGAFLTIFVLWRGAPKWLG
jgi:uncharacterized protein YjbI with pentapeptide repeats